MSKILKFAAIALAASLPCNAAFAAWTLNMTKGVTELCRDIHGLHMMILWICVAIAAVVFGAMIYSLVKFRHSQGAIASQFDHSTKVEVVWTIIPIAILIFIAVPAAETLVKIEDTRNSDLTVQVTGYQWKWHYDYLDQGVNFYSTLARTSNEARQLHSGIDPNSVDNYLLEVDHPLVVPVGKKVRILLTAADVIHAWWVPQFGMKKDAIPGYVNQLWFKADVPGVYRGQCAELCGRDHAFMPVVVEVKSEEDFNSWLKTQQQNAQPTSQVASVPGAANTTLAKTE